MSKRIGHITVKKAGMLSTIQDQGRFGFRRYGIPRSGAIDLKAMHRVNSLLGMDTNNPVIECTMLGGTFEFIGEYDIALCGADMAAKLNGVSMRMEEVISVRSKDTLELGYAKNGMRTYIGFSGKMDVPIVMGSRSTCLVAEFGGFNGRALKKDDVLPIKESTRTAGISQPYSVLNNLYNPIVFNPGPEWDYLPEQFKSSLEKQDFTIDTDSTRQAILLEGEIPILASEHEIKSAPTVVGTVQLLPSGKLAVLMHDGQTTGGYPRIGRINMDDLAVLGQTRLGDSITFRVNYNSVQKLMVDH